MALRTTNAAVRTAMIFTAAALSAHSSSASAQPTPPPTEPPTAAPGPPAPPPVQPAQPPVAQPVPVYTPHHASRPPLDAAPPVAPAAADRAADAPRAAALTDHQKVIRHLGIGFIGVGDLPLPVAKPTGTKGNAGIDPSDRMVLRDVSAPAIGARIWMSRRVAIDAGLGFSYSAGSSSSELGKVERTVDKQSVLAFLVHGGVPLALADFEHMALLVVPEIDFGSAHSTVEPVVEKDAPPAASLAGYRLDLGVRAGAEIQFGFIGLPSLALEASVGLAFTTEWASVSVAGQTMSDTATSLTTTSFDNPWDIFRGVGTVAARYYF